VIAAIPLTLAPAELDLLCGSAAVLREAIRSLRLN
jgi:hypothetical protein